MLEPGQATQKPLLRQILGWVLVLPLLISFVRLPFPLGLVLALGVMAGSVYGLRLAHRHATRRVTLFALIVTLLNGISLIAMGTASLLKAVFYLVWLYAYPHYTNWVYWNF